MNPADLNRYLHRVAILLCLNLIFSAFLALAFLFMAVVAHDHAKAIQHLNGLVRR